MAAPLDPASGLPKLMSSDPATGDAGDAGLGDLVGTEQ
jgi:hypothetical protein